MKMTLVLFWLCSGFFYFTFASYRLRHFSIGDKKDWTDSLDECKEDASSFVTVYDDEDAMFVWKYTKHIDSSRWLGLHRNISITKNTWSNGNPLMVNYSYVSDWTQKCEAIDNDTRRGFNCSERNYFMCYKGNKYTLIENKKDWCQALQYCRKHFDDLVSISNPEQNKEVIAKGKGTTFWIGLRHDSWEWVDKGCSSFRKRDNIRDDNKDDNCTALRHSSKVPHILYQFGCDTNAEAYSFCSKGTVRIKVIGEKKTWEEAFDYCREHHTDLLWIRDRNDSYALDQWLNQSRVDGPFWIGLRQSRVFGFWIWTSESNNAVTWDNWKNGEAPQLPLSDHCAVINETDRTSDGGVWSDENCLVKHHFLCEEKIFFMN